MQDLGILMKPPRRIRKKQIFRNRSKYAALSHENELRIKLFYSSDMVTVDIESFQQFRNMTNKFAFLTPTKLLDVDNYDFNLEYVSYDTDKEEFKFERMRLRTSLPATGNKNESIHSSSFDLLKFIT